MNKEPLPDLTRRDFLRGGSIASLMMLMGGVEVRSAEKKDETPTKYKANPNPVPCGVIGCGVWGREILSTLALLPFAPVLGVCDNYPAYLRRGSKLAPKAEAFTDYRKLLDKKEIKSVIVATPSHLHRQVVLAALQAGKHVYCEAPLATTLEDARAIAQAAKAAPYLYFQTGLQNRADDQLRFLEQFVRTGAAGAPVKFYAQTHKKESWRRPAPTSEREKVINWRLDESISLGLAGELGIHYLDVASWYLMARPVAVSGWGSLIQWRDGRKVPDSVDVLFEYPQGVRVAYSGSLVTSFDSDYFLLYGNYSTLMGRERRAWMFKEVDSPLLGWEVYARKESFYKETGIVLGANATKHAAQGDNPVQDTNLVDPKSPLQYALEAFLINSDLIAAGVEDFKSLYGSDQAALRDYLAGMKKTLVPAAGYEVGYESAVTVIKAHQAVMEQKRLELAPRLFEV